MSGAGENGDDRLSSHYRHLWELCYSTLLKFGCPTMFKKDGPDVPRQLDERITFMVPRDHPRATEVVEYLRGEGKRFVRVERRSQDSEEWFWNTHFEVLLFSGFHGYLEREASEEMAANFAESFMQTLKTEMGKRRDHPKSH